MVRALKKALLNAIPVRPKQYILSAEGIMSPDNKTFPVIFILPSKSVSPVNDPVNGVPVVVVVVAVGGGGLTPTNATDPVIMFGGVGLYT